MIAARARSFRVRQSRSHSVAVSRSLAIGTEDVLELSSTRPEASVTEFFLRVALRFRLLGSAAGIHLKAFGARFDHRRRAPTEVTVRRLDDESWQLVWAVLAWEHARVAESMCARCYISGSIGYRQ